MWAQAVAACLPLHHAKPFHICVAGTKTAIVATYPDCQSFQATIYYLPVQQHSSCAEQEQRGHRALRSTPDMDYSRMFTHAADERELERAASYGIEVLLARAPLRSAWCTHPQACESASLASQLVSRAHVQVFRLPVPGLLCCKGMMHCSAGVD